MTDLQWAVLGFVIACLLVLYLMPTWARHYVSFRREGFGRGTSALYAFSLTIVPMPRVW